MTQLSKLAALDETPAEAARRREQEAIEAERHWRETDAIHKSWREYADTLTDDEGDA